MPVPTAPCFVLVDKEKKREEQLFGEGQFSRVSDLDGRRGFARLAAQGFDLLDDVIALEHLAEHHVLALLYKHAVKKRLSSARTKWVVVGTSSQGVDTVVMKNCEPLAGEQRR